MQQCPTPVAILRISQQSSYTSSCKPFAVLDDSLLRPSSVRLVAQLALLHTMHVVACVVSLFTRRGRGTGSTYSAYLLTVQAYFFSIIFATALCLCTQDVMPNTAGTI